MDGWISDFMKPFDKSIEKIDTISVDNEIN